MTYFIASVLRYISIYVGYRKIKNKWKKKETNMEKETKVVEKKKHFVENE